MQSAESPGCYWILPKDHGETDRSLCPNYFWRLKLVETVLMTVDCIGSHQVYPWKIHETSIFFFGRDPLVPGICLIWSTHTCIGTSEASRIRMPKVENHALRRIFLQINMLSRWMIGPLDDSLVLTTATRRFWSTGQVWTSFPLPPWYGIPWDQIIFSELGTFFLKFTEKNQRKNHPN